MTTTQQIAARPHKQIAPHLRTCICGHKRQSHTPDRKEFSRLVCLVPNCTCRAYRPEVTHD